MSPEQVRSGDVDRRSDIFSAGSMLWSLLTGRKLFVGDNDAATMHNIVDLVVPPPSTVGFQPPAAFDAVCLRALDRDPDKRFASAQAMEDALREAATAAGTLGSRREVGEWIVRTFRDELAERRKVVRAAVGGGPAQRPSAKIELPSFTPSASLNTWQPARSALGETRPAPKLTLRSRYRQLAPWAVPVIAVFALVLWLVLRSKSTPSDLPSAAIGRDTTEPPPHAPAVVQPPSAPAPAPQVVTPAPAVARAPTPAPQAHRDPPQRPALVRRLPVVPKPAPIVTVTPPPPPPPPPPRRWDPDSPEPPP